MEAPAEAVEQRSRETSDEPDDDSVEFGVVEEEELGEPVERPATPEPCEAEQTSGSSSLSAPPEPIREVKEKLSQVPEEQEEDSEMIDIDIEAGKVEVEPK